VVEDAHHFFITICAASVCGGMEIIMERVNYREAIISALRMSGDPLTTSEIWNVIVKNMLLDLNSIKGKTPQATMASLLYRELKKSSFNGHETIFASNGEKPTKYYLKER